MNNKTRQLTEGAMIVAIMGILILADRFTAGLLYAYVYWLMPIPILIYATKYGYKASLVPTVCANVIAIIYAYDLYMKVLVFFSCFIGLCYGGGVKNNKITSKLLLTTFLITLASEIISTFGIPAVLGYDLTEQLREMYSYYMDFLGNSGLQVGDIFNLFKYIYVAAVVATALIETVVTHLIAHILYKKLRIPHEPLKPISLLKLPSWLGWVMLAVIVFSVAAKAYNLLPQFQEYILLVGILCELVFVFMGYYEACVIGRITNNKFLTLIGMIMVFVAPVFLMVLGIFATVTNFREQIIEKVKEANGQGK